MMEDVLVRGMMQEERWMDGGGSGQSAREIR